MDPISKTPQRQIRASYDESTIVVYQAYKSSIADSAVKEQKLNASPDFKAVRMTWIKPSWGWMMYRAGYSYKDPGQERILAIRMKHQDFLNLLRKGVLTTHEPVLRSGMHGDEREVGGSRRGSRPSQVDVRIQWDPERNAKLEILPYRSIQIGIAGSLSRTWVEEWIVSIEDVTEMARGLKRAIDSDASVTMDELVERGLIPEERPFDVPEDIRENLNMG